MLNTVVKCVFLLIVCHISIGSSLKCYTCYGTITEACGRPVKYDVPKKHCDSKAFNETKHLARQIDRAFTEFFEVDLSSQDPKLPSTCLKQITKVGNKVLILRGCQLAPYQNLDICEKVRKFENNNVRTTECKLCNNIDGCNSAPRNFIGLDWFILFMVVAFGSIFYA